MEGTIIMKKILLLVLLLALNLGCSDEDLNGNNELVVTNQALAAVTLNFQGTAHTLAIGESKTIGYIDSGTYNYETAVALPAGATSITMGDHLADTLIFTGDTKTTIFYTGSLLAGVYEVAATISTSNNEE